MNIFRPVFVLFTILLSLASTNVAAMEGEGNFADDTEVVENDQNIFNSLHWAFLQTVGCGVSEGTYKTGGPDALILWSPALDPANDAYFRKLLQGRGQASDYSPLDQVRTKMPPVSIVQGGKDSLTPLSATLRFCEKVTASGGRCQLNVYPGVGHLLTRNLKNQEDDFDPDPASRDDGIAKQNRFLLDLWPPVGR